MSPSSRIPVLDRGSQLRLELKEWEHAFAAAHNGRKPSKAEVKADKVISAKYKEYHRMRAVPAKSSNAPPPPPDPVQTPSKRRTAAPSAHTFGTPSKRTPSAAAAVTPSRRTSDVPWNSPVYDSPGRRRIFGHGRDTIGPTPQRTGRVLGLFESFIDVAASPAQDTTSNGNTNGTGNKEATTMTPRKRKADQVFETPSFLRQRAPADITEVGSPSSFVPRPFAPPKRGLSTLVQELRQMEAEAEAEAFDDDEAVLREMEGLPPLPPKPKPSGFGSLFSIGGGRSLFDPVDPTSEPDLPPPLPDGAWAEDHAVDENLGKEDPNASKWKKKGLKRQHRRVIMRPVPTKPSAAAQEGDENDPPSPTAASNPASDAGSDGSDAEAGDSDDESAYGGSDAPSESESVTATARPSKRAKITAEPKKTAKKGKEKEKKGDDKKDGEKGEKKGIVQKGKALARKINANVQSHMNFRKLNIRGKGAKGRGGGRGRFGRRR